MSRVLGCVVRVSRDIGLGSKGVECYWVRWQSCQWVLGQAAMVIWSFDKGVIEYWIRW